MRKELKLTFHNMAESCTICDSYTIGYVKLSDSSVSTKFMKVTTYDEDKKILNEYIFNESLLIGILISDYKIIEDDL